MITKITKKVKVMIISSKVIALAKPKTQLKKSRIPSEMEVALRYKLLENKEHIR